MPVGSSKKLFLRRRASTVVPVPPPRRSMRRARPLRALPAAVLVVGVGGLSGLGAAVLSTTAPAGASSGAAYTCTAGNIPAGTYASVTVSGICFARAGNVTVTGNLTIEPGALLDARAPGDPASTPKVPAVVTVGGNVVVGAGGVLWLGCSVQVGCNDATTYDHIGGNITATGAQGVVIHSATVAGSVTISGGGGGATSCTVSGEPWATDATALATSYTPAHPSLPPYDDVETTVVGGGLTVSGVTTCWIGAIRNHVTGNVTFADDRSIDPDGNEDMANLVTGSLSCTADTPAIHFGDSGAAPNIVGAGAIGQCAFGVTQPNPTEPTTATAQKRVTGQPEDVAVSKQTLRAYTGTLLQPKVVGYTGAGPTETGDTLLEVYEDFTISGTGLTGTGIVNPNVSPTMSPGAEILLTDYPSGEEALTFFGNCTPCSFAGKQGLVSLRAFGTSTGHTTGSGWFLLTAGGTRVTGRPNGLDHLVGYGTYTATAGVVHLTEYLGFANETDCVSGATVGGSDTGCAITVPARTVTYAPGSNGSTQEIFTVAGGKVYESVETAGGNWSPWTSLGGEGFSGPVTYAPGSNGSTQELFAVAGGDVYVSWESRGGAWSPWVSLGGEGFSGSVTYAPGSNGSTQELFAVAGGGVYVSWESAGGAWSGWESLGGSGLSGPLTYAQGSNGSVQELFGVSGGHAAVSWESPGGAWSPWESLGGAGLSGPLTYAPGSNGSVQELFGVAGGDVYASWELADGAWSAWASRGSA